MVILSAVRVSRRISHWGSNLEGFAHSSHSVTGMEPSAPSMHFGSIFGIEARMTVSGMFGPADERLKVSNCLCSVNMLCRGCDLFPPPLP